MRAIVVALALSLLAPSVLAPSLLGCNQTQRYAYVPVTTTGAEIGGPRGKLEATSLGVARVAPPSRLAGPAFNALYLRVTVTNDSPEPWTFDQGEQRIELAERGARIYSDALTATGERPPVVVVPAAHAVTFDLSFPVGTRDDASDLPGFTFLWTVRAGGEVAAGRIVFARKMERVMTMVPADLPPYRMPANPANDRRDPCRP